jgi:hypothetical protein
MQNMVILLGLLCEIAGVCLYSWGEIRAAAATMRYHARDPDFFTAALHGVPWWSKWPIRLAARCGAQDVSAFVFSLSASYALKCWGLASLVFGGLLHVCILGWRLFARV